MSRSSWISGILPSSALQPQVSVAIGGLRPDGLVEVAAVQVGDGPGHPQDAVIAPGGEPHAGQRRPCISSALALVQGAEPAQLLPGPSGRCRMALPDQSARVLDVPGRVRPALR